MLVGFLKQALLIRMKVRDQAERNEALTKAKASNQTKITSSSLKEVFLLQVELSFYNKKMEVIVILLI